MTELLERAFNEAASLSEAEQDALAARMLAEMDDERAWDRAFESTTDQQLDRLANLARKATKASGSASLDDLIQGRRD